MQIVWWTRFKSFFKVLLSPTQRTESCLGSFPKPELNHSSLVAYWLLLWSLPRARMLTPVLLILLSSGYHHPPGKVPGPFWSGLSPGCEERVSLNTILAHWAQKIHFRLTERTHCHCLPSGLGLSVQSLARRWELAQQRVPTAWVICFRMEAAANQERLSWNPSRLWLLPEDQNAGMGLAFSLWWQGAFGIELFLFWMSRKQKLLQSVHLVKHSSLTTPYFRHR